MSRILLLLLLSAFPAVAQDSATAGARSAGDESGSQENDPVGARSAGDQSRSQSAPTGSDESRSQTAPTGEDPFDYESSEQISEDLSVSFPVDI